MTRFTSFFDKGISLKFFIFVSGIVALFATAIALF